MFKVNNKKTPEQFLNTLTHLLLATAESEAAVHMCSTK